MLPSERTLARSGVGNNNGYSDNYAYKPVSGEPQDAGYATGVPLQYQDGMQAAEYRPEQLTGCAREMAGFSAIFCQWLNVMLVFVPLGVVSGLNNWSSASRFSLNFLAIIPLAGILGAATESLACHTGQMIGGLLNATFGNAVEMIVTVNAIRANLVDVVQGSLLGSILSNLLLVLGMAFFAAGCITSEPSFNATGAATNTSCLVLASTALALPTIYNYLPGATGEEVLAISRISSCVLAAIYLLFLFFQLKTHAHLFADEGEEEETDLSALSSVLILFGATCAVAVCSEILVDSIEGVTEDYGMPKAFIGVILLPIVGNAAEHTTAVTVAIKGKMDLSLGVAVGSSTQIALFVVPFAVLIGWWVDVEMTLDFRCFDATVLLLSVFLASSVLHDGHANWLEGAMLIGTYILIAVIAWYIPEPQRL
jgi:Ca2+:H+ antiporter